MKISYNWLRQYMSIPETAEEIGRVLTATGLEVESIELLETVRGGLKGLVIGEVKTCMKHPNADKLSVTTVDIGASVPSHIVCGASNVAAGLKVVVALPGTTLYPFKGDPFIIKTTKIRGEQSEGMICAADEIGLGDDHEGIIVLDQHAPTGGLVADYFKIDSDYVLEIGLTPNRADAASHIGVARDIKAAKNYTLKFPSITEFAVESTSLPIRLSVEDANACPRYTAVTISGITVKESPDWLKNRIRSIGLTPINNVVDITNFVLHETGQPLHAYDAARIAGGEVIVKTLPAGTRFVTLDNKERTLTATDLMVCDANMPMCIAGVFGGINSGVTSETNSLFLESAWFSATSVRRTGLHHQLKTDASFRFERGTDPEMTVYALKRAALLITELAGGKISSGIIDFYPVAAAHKTIEISDEHVNRLIGIVIPRDRIFSILESLDIRVVATAAKTYHVSVPPYRVDVTQEADVIEEILRIYGFNNIELASGAGTSFLAPFPAQDINKFRRSTGEMLAANGFYEIVTNSLTNVAYQQKYALTFEGETVSILNKLSEEQGVLRQTMLFTGLEVCAHNINRQQRDLKLFEYGKIYWKDSAYHEAERLAIYMSGNYETENWQNKTRPLTYFDLAQQVSNILEKCTIKNFSQEKLDDPLFDFGMRMIHDKVEICKVGKVKSSFVKDFGVRNQIFYADLDVALLFKFANPKFEVLDVPRFPEVRRDLSLVLDKVVTFDDIRGLVLATEKKLIKDIVAFDVYEGDKIPDGKKAYALAFTLLDETRTLTDNEIDRTMNRLMSALEQKMGAFIRK